MKKVKIPAGEKITISHGKLSVPDHPIVAFIEGDGTGPDIWAASVRVLDAAVAQAYKGRRKIAWVETYAGDKAYEVYGQDCPPSCTTASYTSPSRPPTDRKSTRLNSSHLA